MENKKFLPKELLADVIHFVPFNLKWKDIRTSKLFDLFMIKFQQKCIIYLSSSKAEVLADYKSIINNLKSMDGHEKQFVLSEVFFIDNCFEPLYRGVLLALPMNPVLINSKKS
uniref:Uncharacterized protein n=1 Tax=Meloidogyne enterolobii TaxID=390850 RepID=A0A6V7WUA6_MELEN|nr:unnamed protein product [Meloidogyne enterolobii]